MKVYITVPFTSHVNKEGIAEEPFVKFIDMIDSTVKKFKFSTYITYRDFFKWGKVIFNPDTVYEKFKMELETSELVIAVNPNEGQSTNLVLGIAAALKKEIIILLDNKFEKNSLIGLMYQGLKNMTNSNVIFYNDINDLKVKLRNSLRGFTRKNKHLAKQA